MFTDILSRTHIPHPLCANSCRYIHNCCHKRPDLTRILHNWDKISHECFTNKYTLKNFKLYALESTNVNPSYQCLG
jgi:hypothetical protein